MAANEVVWYHHLEPGAPVLNNTAGSLVALLDACLVNGFNAKAVQGLTVAGGVATATISAHGYENEMMVEFAGAEPAALNGRQRITATGSNTLRFAAPGVPDGAAAGTVTARRSPLGWVKRFGDATRAVYGRTHPQATAMLLRIDDTAAGVATRVYARAQMVETAADVDTVTGIAPNVSQVPGGTTWTKGSDSTTAKRWLLVGDARTFYFFVESDVFNFTSGHGLLAFGDITSFRAGDSYHCMIAGGSDAWSHSSALNSLGWTAGVVVARYANQLGGAASLCMGGLYGQPGSNAYPIYPSPVDNGMVVQPGILVMEQDAPLGNPYRGTLRGLAAPLARIGTRLDRQVLKNLIGSDHDLLSMSTYCTQAGDTGAVFVDLTGPWS